LKSVLLIIPAQNFNEEEYLIISNALEKSGIKIFIASDSDFLCLGSEGMKVKNDVQFYNIHESNFDGLILVGGAGMRTYWNNPAVKSAVQKFSQKQKPVGAICSASVILAKAGVLGEFATCYPDDKNELLKCGIEYREMPVVSRKNIVTARDPASTPEFIEAFLYELSKGN
jgi:putative intracellular protease/amidase